MIKKIVVSFTVLISSLFAFAQNTSYQKIKVYANYEQLANMAKAGLCVDHGELLPGKFLIHVFSEKEIKKIEALGISYDILIDDMQKYITNQNKNYQKKAIKQTCATNAPDYPIPANFKVGSFAGYFTYDEMLANLDSMHAQYPNLITKRMVAHDSLKTIEGRDLYYVRLSDNPDVDEEEPEVFYNALHHAREPLSMQHLIFYMWYLLENYETNDNVKRAVDHVEMYFLPCVNPDGYMHDYSIEPEGGGFWRKNRRQNEDGTFGVDLNRNYGYNWGFDDVGSSTDTDSPVYRGTGPFSEPETQIVKEFCEAHEFLITLNCHTSGNLLIYPWGYDYSLFTIDSAQFVNYAEVMTKYNNYTYGTGDQTVNYIVNGSSDDWMYHETELKNKILAMTPESGRPDYGFYPPMDEIIPICKDNVWQNLQAANLTLGYVEVEDISPLYLNEKNGYLQLNALRLGMQDEAVTIRLQPNDQISSEDNIRVENLDLLGEQLDSIAYTIADDVVNGSFIQYDMVVEYAEKSETFSYQKIYMPQPILVFEDQFENSDQWEGEWGLTDDRAYEGFTSFTDSPKQGTEYFLGERLTSETSQYIDLTNARAAVLECNAIWNILARYDYAQISVKSRNSQWIPLCGNYTKAGNGFQDEFEPLYDGFRVNWVQENFSLNEFAGEEIKIQLKTGYGFFTENEGFYIDNMKLWIEENLSPQATNDVQSIYTSESTPIFVLENDTDPENDALNIQIVQQPKFGIAELVSDTLFYTVNEDIAQQQDTIIYKACDVFKACSEAMAIINIDLETGSIAPVALNDTLSIVSLNQTTIAVLNNDTDPLEGILAIEILEQPAYGTSIILDYGNPSIAYTINENFTNEVEDRLTYVACSGNGICDTAQVVFLLDVISSVGTPFAITKGINMYPNPANEMLFIEPLQQAGELVLYNANGQVIQSYLTGLGQTEIITKNLAEGLYYVQFNAETVRGYLGKVLVVHD